MNKLNSWLLAMIMVIWGVFGTASTRAESPTFVIKTHAANSPWWNGAPYPYWGGDNVPSISSAQVFRVRYSMWYPTMIMAGPCAWVRYVEPVESNGGYSYSYQYDGYQIRTSYSPLTGSCTAYRQGYYIARIVLSDNWYYSSTPAGSIWLGTAAYSIQFAGGRDIAINVSPSPARVIDLEIHIGADGSDSVSVVNTYVGSNPPNLAGSLGLLPSPSVTYFSEYAP